jgi:hypothetical protein
MLRTLYKWERGANGALIMTRTALFSWQLQPHCCNTICILSTDRHSGATQTQVNSVRVTQSDDNEVSIDVG